MCHLSATETKFKKVQIGSAVAVQLATWQNDRWERAVSHYDSNVGREGLLDPVACPPRGS